MTSAPLAFNETARLDDPQVRYFQAWSEPILPGDPDADADVGEDDGGEWGDFGDTGTTPTTTTATTSGLMTPGGVRGLSMSIPPRYGLGLPPVSERSEGGSSSTDMFFGITGGAGGGTMRTGTTTATTEATTTTDASSSVPHTDVSVWGRFEFELGNGGAWGRLEDGADGPAGFDRF